MNKEKYTGRQIAIFTDCHALYEPTKSILEDIKKRNITEIYSLGDNIGVGPNPSEVLDLLKEYNVISIKGNSEEYYTLGIEPFKAYFDTLKTKSYLWTKSKLNEEQIGDIKLFPHSIELLIGGQKIALCHFANDVRIDFRQRSTHSYQRNFPLGEAYRQFLYTNSKTQLEEIEEMIKIYGENNPLIRGYLSAKDDPLFRKKRVDFFDAIIQGHVHYKLYEESEKTKFYTIRAVGIGYKKDEISTASYVILKEKTNNEGFDLEEVLVKYDREKMKYQILNSDSPDHTIEKFTNIRR